MLLMLFLTFVELAAVEAVFGPSRHKSVSDEVKESQRLVYGAVSAFVIIANIIYVISERM